MSLSHPYHSTMRALHGVCAAWCCWAVPPARRVATSHLICHTVYIMVKGVHFPPSYHTLHATHPKLPTPLTASVAACQVAGEQLVPQSQEGLQRLILAALLMPRALGLSPSDVTTGKHLAISAKVQRWNELQTSTCSSCKNCSITMDNDRGIAFHTTYLGPHPIICYGLQCVLSLIHTVLQC